MNVFHFPMLKMMRYINHYIHVYTIKLQGLCVLIYFILFSVRLYKKTSLERLQCCAKQILKTRLSYAETILCVQIPYAGSAIFTGAFLLKTGLRVFSSGNSYSIKTQSAGQLHISHVPPAFSLRTWKRIKLCSVLLKC